MHFAKIHLYLFTVKITEQKSCTPVPYADKITVKGAGPVKYDVYKIKTPEDLRQCPVFFVDQFNWGGQYRPVTFGRLGFLVKKGFLLEMECQETDPCRTFTEDNDPVYLDSAMEAFFCFTPGEAAPCYLNFEMNANGAMLACYGRNRTERIPFSKTQKEDLFCLAQIREHAWGIRLTLPLTLITAVYPGLVLDTGSIFTCNFYKIKESENRTHFASFTPIPVPEPDFHLPEYFAQAQILS